MSLLKTSVFNFAFGCVAHAGARRGQWQSGGRHQSKQLNLSSHRMPWHNHSGIWRYICCNCVFDFTCGCWACVLKSTAHLHSMYCKVMVWCEGTARPSIPWPRHWARSECQGGVVFRACRASFAEPGFLTGPLHLTQTTPANRSEGFPGVCSQRTVVSYFAVFTVMSPFLLCLSDV